MAQAQQSVSLIPELQDYISQLEAIKRDAADLTAGMTETQFNWRPAPGQWSVAECLAHLNATAQQYIPLLSASIAEARERGWLSQGPFRYGWLGNRFVRAMEPPVKMKFKAPKAFVPLPDQPMSKTVPEFMELQDQFISLIGTANGLDLKRARVPSPATKLIKLSLGQGFALITGHERRHLRQARQVKNHPDFP
ncbi:MAG TPA: DinB family protein [Blastocatellia bacterium]|nr:DinB family protein [Blastocatellia bacterium]